jgi:hypothetical protein
VTINGNSATNPTTKESRITEHNYTTVKRSDCDEKSEFRSVAEGDTYTK